MGGSGMYTARSGYALLNMTLSGNKPPWTLAQKADYSKYDTERAKKYFGLSNLRVPDFFPIISLLPQRALVYVKSQYPQVYVQTFLDIFAGMWEDGYDVSKSELLSKVLSKRFDKDQVGDILEKAKKDECKQALNANTKESLDRGAFGCPWFWVRNSRGQEQPFFGSDRCVISNHRMVDHSGMIPSRVLNMRQEGRRTTRLDPCKRD